MPSTSILSDIHANIDALEAVLARGRRRPGIARSCSAIWSATARSRTPSSNACCALDPLVVIRGNHDKAACGIEDGSSFNHVAGCRAVDLRGAHRRKPRVPARAAAGPVVDRRHGRDLPRRAVRRGPLHLRLRRRQPRARRREPAALPVRPHASAGGLPTSTRHSSTGSCRKATRRLELPIERGMQLPGQCRVGRPAARRRSARGVRHLRRRRQRRCCCAGSTYPVEMAQRRILNAGLPASLANRLAVGASRRRCRLVAGSPVRGDDRSARD